MRRELELWGVGLFNALLLIVIVAVALYIANDLEFGGPLNEAVAFVVAGVALGGWFMLITGWRPWGKGRRK